MKRMLMMKGCVSMKQAMLWISIGCLLPLSSSCLPDNYFANILGSTGAELASFALSEAVNYLFPPA